MNIIDAQIHLWQNGVPTHKPAHRQVPAYTAADAIAEMDGAGVTAAVVHPPSWQPEIYLARDAARQYPDRFAVMGLLPLDQEHDRSLMAPGWVGDIGRIAERFPGLHLTLDHLGGLGGSTKLKDAAAMTYIPEVLALAKFPNIGIKLTGAPGYAGDAYPFPAMQGFVRQLFDAFGPDRVFWGSDISKMPCSWRQCVTMFTEELPWLSEHDKKRVMGDALCDWWGWSRI
jgi:predicted TIM-barrel fold metal-dependent hydrolase